MEPERNNAAGLPEPMDPETNNAAGLPEPMEPVAPERNNAPETNNAAETGLPEAGCPGFVRLVSHMGDDAAVAAMARLSYAAGTRPLRQDAILIRYLMRHRHTSPFEGVVFKFHVKCPITVARQWLRHRTASYNEQSLRYSEAPADPPYVPSVFARQSAANRQGSGLPFSADANRQLNAIAAAAHSGAVTAYRALLDRGVARETARGVLPVETWTEFSYVQNLHNVFHFLALRTDAHAQREIRAYAHAVGRLVARVVPVCYAAYADYVLHAVTLTAAEVAALRPLLAGATVPPIAATGREEVEWAEKFGRAFGARAEEDPAAPA